MAPVIIDPDEALARLRTPEAPETLAARIIARARQLPESARRRFVEEVRLLWLLPHPALCALVLFAVGIAFGMGALSPVTDSEILLATYDSAMEEDWL